MVSLCLVLRLIRYRGARDQVKTISLLKLYDTEANMASNCRVDEKTFISKVGMVFYL